MTASASDLNAAAAQLCDAFDRRTPCPPLRTAFPAMTPADAYAVQRINIDRATDSGRRLVGRKIGLTSRVVQQQLGVDQPDFGALFADMCFGDGEEMPWSGFMQPRVEAEFLFVLGRDLMHEHLCATDIIGAIDYALPAIEVVDSRIAKWDIGLVDTVADNASCGAVVERRGEPVSVGAGAACLGHPLNAVLWLARKMVETATPLVAGDMVLSGALGLMVAANPGDVFEARISGQGSVRAVFGTDVGAAA